MTVKTVNKKNVLTAIVALAMIAGAAGFGSLFSRTQANAQTTAPVATSPTTVAVTPTTGDIGSQVTPSSGTFHSNEDPAHESKESPAREAQENAGQHPMVQ